MWWPNSQKNSATPEPAPRPFVTLGSGEAAGRGIAPKAALLDRAAESDLAVPAGVVVPSDVSPTEADLAALRGWFAGQHIAACAVRSAFGAEDGAAESLAGWFESELHVPVGELGGAIDRVRSSADRRDGAFRTDVLVMAMVDASRAGVAFSEPGTYDDIVNVSAGTADKLVSGEVEGDRLELPRLEQAQPGWKRRLQHLLAEVRSAFGDEPWDIEWADDGDTCWIVQIRPITAAPLRDQVLTAANHAEILPPLPSTLMATAIADAGPELFDWYRQRVPGLPADRDFLHVKLGRPLINLSLLEDMMRELGLPTALVADSIGGGSGRDVPAQPVRVARSIPSLIRLGWAQIVAVVRSRRNEREVARIGTPAATTFSAFVDDLRAAHVKLVTGMFPLSSAIGPPMSALRAAGTLHEHASRHRTITAELADAVRALGADRSPRAIADFLEEWGHRGVFESDIARPRYADDPSLLASGGHAPALSTSPPNRTMKGWLTLPLWWLCVQPMAARERYRHESMRAFAAVRRAGAALAGDAVERGVFRTVDDLWLLTTDEVRQLDSGWVPDAAFWSAREVERAEHAAIDMPHVVGLHDDPSVWNDELAEGDLTGIALTTGTVTGTAWVLDEPATAPPERVSDESVVLVARSIDAGWISTLQMVDAVVVEIGGDLSHGSILVRELGLPAVTNVRGATRAIETGTEVTVHAAAGRVTLGADTNVT